MDAFVPPDTHVPMDAGLRDTPSPDDQAMSDVGPTCTDGLHNGDETARDCGGDCPSCADNFACIVDGDCQSDFCHPVSARCVRPTCRDGFHNGTESALDCGGICAGCAVGETCADGADCRSAMCETVCTTLRDCTTLHERDPSLSSGVYQIDVDEEGPLLPMDAYCDMVTSGGGWTLVLNYMHQGGTNPGLSIRRDSLPLQGTVELGRDESRTEFWGHAANTLLAEMAFDDMRFYGVSRTYPDRVVHFSNRAAEVHDYMRTGTGDALPEIYDPAQTFLFDDHTAALPLAVVSGSGYNWRSNRALTDYPFYGTSD